MHVYSLWWKLLAGKYKAPGQAKTKTKTRKKAGLARTTDPPSIPSAGDHGPRKTPARATPPPAEDVNVIGSLLRAMGPRRLRAMTSRSRVGGSKYKVNNQNLEKFEVILAKIPEGEKVSKRVSSVTSLPERHEDLTRLTGSPGDRTERPAPDISPSLTMGSSVTAEYELFCKEFHSEAKHLLPDEQQPQVCSNPMRQLLQSASEAATKGLQLQRVSAAAGACPSGGVSSAVKPESMLSQTNEPPGISKVPGFVASVLSSSTATSAALTSKAPQPPPPPPLSPKKAAQSRRWSETPIGTPVFMAKKFAEKMRNCKDPLPAGGGGGGGGSRKGSTSLPQDPKHAAATSSSKPGPSRRQSIKSSSKHTSSKSLPSLSSGSVDSVQDELEERSQNHQAIRDRSGSAPRTNSTNEQVSAKVPPVQQRYSSRAEDAGAEETQLFRKNLTPTGTPEASEETGSKRLKSETSATSTSKSGKSKDGKSGSTRRKKR
ncbi:uncharacterized protein LOC144138219 [Haemaphysalis longicornis]